MNLEKFNCKLLNANNLDIIEQLILTRNTLGDANISNERSVEIINQIKGGLIDYPGSTFVFGTFDSIGLMCLMTCEISNKFPKEWLMSYIITNPNRKLPWNYKKNGVGECWEKAFTGFEKHGYKKCYWSLPTKWENQQSAVNQLDCCKRYVRAIETRVLANTYPKDEKIRWIYGKRVKPYDVTIRSASLKSL